MREQTWKEMVSGSRIRKSFLKKIPVNPEDSKH